MFPSFTRFKSQHRHKSVDRISTETDSKSFHIMKQTVCHNFFKKINPPEFYMKQSLTKFKPNQSYSTMPFKWNSKATNSIHHDQIKPIQKLMNRKKGQLEREINQSFLQVNRSFGRYIQDKSGQNGVISQQRKKTISCKNLLNELKQMQTLKKLNFPLVNVNQKNLLEMAAETNYEINHLECNCLDSLFPFERYGATICSYQNELILYGGFSSGKRPAPVSCFHKYNFDTKMWTKVEQSSPKPLAIVPCFHTVDIYKNYMIVVGGISIGPQTGRRKYNSDICLYNFEKKEWSKLRFSLAIRSHASTLFGNTLLIHGGIDERQVNSNQMHFINFNANSIQNSLILETQNREYSLMHKHSLAHHTLVNTNEIDPNLKMLLKYDGVFCFGGVNQDGEMHNDITFLNCIGKENALDVRFQSWVPVELNGMGPRPQARKKHSFNMMNKKGLILLIGGENMDGQVLNDIWIFNLIKLQWKEIIQLSSPMSEILTGARIIKQLKLQKGISGHSTTLMSTRLIVFGGRRAVDNKKQNCLWLLQTDMSNNMRRTQQIKMQKFTSTSVNTIKQSTRDESMWNIQF